MNTLRLLLETTQRKTSYAAQIPPIGKLLTTQLYQENPNFIPTLTAQNTTQAKRILEHEDKSEISLSGGGSTQLKHGDTIHLVHDVKIT